LDRRTVTALGIIGLIFVLLPFYWEWIGFSKKPAPPVESQLGAPGAESVGVATDSEYSSDSGALPGVAATAEIQPDNHTFDTLPEQFTIVETDLYTARFTSRGAGIA